MHDCIYLLAVRLGTVALISLVRSSVDESNQAGELIETIRNAINSSSIAKSWSIDKITILGESDSVPAEIMPTNGKNNHSNRS